VVPSVTVLQGHALAKLRELPDESVQSCISSPPYWGLRAYGTEPQVWGGNPDCIHAYMVHIQPAANGIIHDGGMSGETLSSTSATRKPKKSAFCTTCGCWRGELGLEPTPELFVEHIVEVFREVRRVLRKDGTLWVNLGDSYSSQSGGDRKDHAPGPNSCVGGTADASAPRCGRVERDGHLRQAGLKPKDLVGMPWRVAFALQSDGWYLRRDIIWSKPNPMPESVRDRPTSAHEYIFLLSQSEKYYYDADAIAEPVAVADWNNGSGVYGGVNANGQNAKQTRTTGRVAESKELGGPNSGMRKKHCPNNSQPQTIEARAAASERMGREPGWRNTEQPQTRNKRSVWTIATQPYPEAHFATYPPELARTCILAGCPEGGIVLDPFGGSGTTGAEALALGRSAILIELQEKYIPLIEKRVGAVTPGFQFEEAASA
jgi:DNA modification methylase